MHPDFNEIRSKDEFHEWAAKQDPTIQGWLYENTSNAKLAARAIDLYKMDTGQSKLTKKEEKDVKKKLLKQFLKLRKVLSLIFQKKSLDN